MTNLKTVDEDKLTKVQKEFINSTFETPKGGTITVIGVDKSKGYPYKRYTCECSICSQDKELWPCGSITAEKHKLYKGIIPCGCSKFPKYTEDQLILLIKRKCEIQGYEFLGWYGTIPTYDNKRTRVILYNPATGNTWSTNNITRFLAIV